ncbi:lipopolysaccharide biosynthesis protein [uncultured Sphingomonas sp.]|uniref:lipopolysaccharide biosynthesis protein n=1 Tax=uncultured Sphingomonas sp. TaxID=158754 RepID=UPI0025DB4305|nr:lipopolysaccharide biosynthesis protein [uncultured Sphingomonas sp.]
MNMHGIMAPAGSEEHAERGFARDAYGWVRRNRLFMYIVVLPTLLVACYLFLVASDQYESEAHFLVRSSDVAAVPGTGVSQALSVITGVGPAQTEAMSVADYLTSHDAVDSLRRDDQLVERFSRKDADIFSRLWQSNPSPEQLLRYYRRQVKVHYNTETGITTLDVRSFRPEDSYGLARKLLDLGEQRVNTLNVRSYSDAVRMAEKQLARAETDLAAAQGQLTSFRQSRREIDPEASGQAQLGLVAQLTEQLATSRAQLSAMGQAIDRNSPQYRALADHVSALQAQVNAQSGRLAGGTGAIASNIGGFQKLELRQQFLAKRYEAAAASLDRARDQAIRKQLYLVRVVDANMPVKALYPERWRILATVVIALLLAYSIGWLIAAGVREHAA